jgi:superoxide dismutase
MFKRKELKYEYGDLVPFVSEKALRVHYDGHYVTYASNFNKALDNEKVKGKNCKEIFSEIQNYSEFLKNNAGGY